MARGGYRPGAGRPKGQKVVREKAGPKRASKVVPAPAPSSVRDMVLIKPVPMDIQLAADAAHLDPLQYMLKVMNDSGASDERRDRMAVSAAPYCHERAADRKPGKKQEAENAATTAGEGTEWGDDLNVPSARVN